MLATTNSSNGVFKLDDPLGTVKEDQNDFEQKLLDDQMYPYCFLQSKNKEYCYTQEFSILLLSLCSLAFLYQIIFVWMLSFQYRFLAEKRL